MVSFSLVIPVYRNEENIPALIEALESLNASLDKRLEVIFVVDGSPDRSGELIIQARNTYTFASKILFHSRNFGSFVAIRSGIGAASAKYIGVMAADLQEPPELVANFFSILESDKADVVFGQRVGRNDPPIRKALSKLFWVFYRRTVIRDMPSSGVDMFACTSQVRDVLLKFEEPNSSLIGQLFWVGFRRAFVPYTRQERISGRSAWNFSRRLRYMLDSILSFSDLPIVLALWGGVAALLISLVLSLYYLVAWAAGLITVPGFTTIVLLITVLGSINLTVTAIVGSYVWRTFENTKKRPIAIICRVIE